jgi:hypothetical protein
MVWGTATATQTHPEGVTLLELVSALDKLYDSPDEVANRAREMIETGAVRLCGNFRDDPRALLV